MKKFLIYTILCFLLASCHSSRKALPVRTEIELPEISYESPAIKPSTAKAIEKEARKWLGVPYKYGGTTRRGVDCSGLVMEVFATAANVKLPRNSAEQQKYCTPVEKRRLSTGDLVFFSSSKSSGRVTHVGIYLDKGNFIHSSSSKGVMISSLDEIYYINHFHSAGRVPGIATTKAVLDNTSKKSGKTKKSAIHQEVHNALTF